MGVELALKSQNSDCCFELKRPPFLSVPFSRGRSSGAWAIPLMLNPDNTYKYIFLFVEI